MDSGRFHNVKHVCDLCFETFVVETRGTPRIRSREKPHQLQLRLENAAGAGPRPNINRFRFRNIRPVVRRPAAE